METKAALSTAREPEMWDAIDALEDAARLESPLVRAKFYQRTALDYIARWDEHGRTARLKDRAQGANRRAAQEANRRRYRDALSIKFAAWNFIHAKTVSDAGRFGMDLERHWLKFMLRDVERPVLAAQMSRTAPSRKAVRDRNYDSVARAMDQLRSQGQVRRLLRASRVNRKALLAHLTESTGIKSPTTIRDHVSEWERRSGATVAGWLADSPDQQGRC